ncbi:MAG: response regulator [Anaerolineae bacterium]|nr:response regulator [Anaerolineae bacterium]
MDKRRYTVLVVDDEDDALMMVELLLRDSQFDVIKAVNGEEALAIAQSQEADIVLLDIMMPDISGVTVCGYLRANPRTSNVPIVMLTALDDYATRRKAMDAGANDLITKPVFKDELVTKLSSIIAEHNSSSQAPAFGD